ncbi:MAG: sensor histidine kinase, partial [Desulfuromusa sp.]|nr:sensor histidine kinase [Desulfuromusa sp.]
FIIAILLGGSLLLWQAYRNHRDAVQKISFISNVSHELKTPLTTIRMYAELLGEGKITDGEKQQRYLQTIIKESQRLTRLVGNVLDFSRLEQGQRSYQRSKLNLNQMLRELTEQLLPRLNEVDMVLEMNLPDDPIELYSDRDALEQIILNLFDNGIKYAATGKKLQLDLERQGNNIRLRLQDWGPGVPQDQKEKIFDKFHRVDNSLTTRQQGSGLGLSIARQLAEGLGGSLNFCPIDGSGCCIELSLPATGGK